MMHVHVNGIAKTHHNQDNTVNNKSENQCQLSEHAKNYINIDSQKWVLKLTHLFSLSLPASCSTEFSTVNEFLIFMPSLI